MLDLINLKDYFKILNFSFFQLSDILEFLIIVMIMFYITKHFKKTRIYTLVKGLLIILVVYGFATFLSLNIIKFIFESLISVLLIGLIVIFSPEIRKTIENIGNKKIKINFRKNKNDFKQRYTDKNIDEIINSCLIMSKAKTGALILIERKVPLTDYEKTGIAINSDISQQLIVNIFEKNTPLHDGAMIIKDNKISAATCYLPLSENSKINKNLGTRHRAGIGASEETDALVIMVSEETGKISIAENGKIKHHISEEVLRDSLQKYQNTDEKLEPKSLTEKFNELFLSIIMGFLIWCILCFSIDPITTTTIKDIPVEVLNDNIVSSTDHTYEIINGKTVTINITGRKSELINLDEKDFKATADFKNLSIANAVIIDVVCDNENITIDTKNSLMQIAMDEEITSTCKISIQKEGKEKEGYFAYEIIPDVKEVEVSGPQKIIKTLNEAKVVVNVDGIDKNKTEIVDVVLYDKNGNLLDVSNCTLNKTKINIKINVLESKKVPIKILLNNTSDSVEYEIIDQILSEEEIEISAPKHILDKLEELEVTIDPLQFKIHSSKINTMIDLINYIPDNIYLVDPETSINMNLSLKEYKIQTFTLTNKDITILGGDNKDIKFENETFEIPIKYNADTINELKVSYIEPTIDVSQLEAGEHEVIVTFKDDPALEIKKELKIKITIKEKGDADDTE